MVPIGFPYRFNSFMHQFNDNNLAISVMHFMLLWLKSKIRRCLCFCKNCRISLVWEEIVGIRTKRSSVKVLIKLHCIINWDSEVSPMSQSSMLKVCSQESPLPKYSDSSVMLFVKVTFWKWSIYKSFLNICINLTIKSLLMYLLFDKFNSFTLNYSLKYKLKLESFFNLG